MNHQELEQIFLQVKKDKSISPDTLIAELADLGVATGKRYAPENDSKDLFIEQLDARLTKELNDLIREKDSYQEVIHRLGYLIRKNATELNLLLDDMEDPEFVFYCEPVPEDVMDLMDGVSYPPNDGVPFDHVPQIDWEDLAYVHVLHYDFDGIIRSGELICNIMIAYDLLEIFQELFLWKYPIEKIRLVDEYDAVDEDSMADNNSSAFNYRVIYGTDTISNHAMGFAVDINPLYNPYISYHDGKEVIQPANSAPYTNRSLKFDHKIDHDDLCYQLFTAHDFTWGGDWEDSKDYQHFEKII